MPQVSKAQAKKQIRYLESGEAVYVLGSLTGADELVIKCRPVRLGYGEHTFLAKPEALLTEQPVSGEPEVAPVFDEPPRARLSGKTVEEEIAESDKKLARWTPSEVAPVEVEIEIET